MFTFLIILIILACLFLILVVLIQNPKGGGIAANFMSTTQFMGVKKTTDMVEKATWVLAVALMVLSLSTNFFRPTTGGIDQKQEFLLDKQVDEAPSTGPATPPPASQPEQTPAQ